MAFAIMRGKIRSNVERCDKSFMIFLLPLHEITYLSFLSVYFYRTFPMIHASLLVTISTREEGVQAAKTSRSATDRFKRKRFVELLRTFEVKMTIMTRALPNKPTAKMTEQRTRLVHATYSGSSVGVKASSSTRSVVLFMMTDNLNGKAETDEDAFP